MTSPVGLPFVDVTRIESRLDTLEELRVDLTGSSGTNGKVGTLRKDVEDVRATLRELRGRAWGLFMLFAGGLGAAAVKLILVGRAYGALEDQVEAQHAQLALQQTEIQALQALAFAARDRPAPAPGKDTDP